MACQGLGAIVGALTIGSLGRFKHMGRALLVVQIAARRADRRVRACRARCRSAWRCSSSAACSSWRVFSISFSLVQLTVPDELRGRVVSIYMVALRGGWPLGGLVAGAMADKFGAPHVMAVNGAAAALAVGRLLSVHRARALADA